MINLTALYYYLATQLHTSIYHYTAEKKFFQTYTRRKDLQDGLFCKQTEAYLLGLASDKGPVIAAVNHDFIYGTVQTEDAFYIIGPVYMTDSIDISNHLEDIPCPDGYVQQIFGCTLPFFMNHLLLLYNLFHAETLSLQNSLLMNSITQQIEVTAYSQFSDLLFTNREYSQKHNPYDQEQREMLSIESGDLNQLKKSWDEEYSGSFGITSKDPARNGRNLATIVIALATRAAIRGGLLPEIALSLGDVYMQKIDEAANLFDLNIITKNAEYTLAQMVYEEKNRSPRNHNLQENPVIELCKDYVSSHLHSKLTVQEIAEHLHIHTNYLSSAFHKYEGISLYQYILSEKVASAKNFLIYSDYSFSEISTYLGFSSQSHLGKVFKKATGFTLQQYKNKYYKSENWN